MQYLTCNDGKPIITRIILLLILRRETLRVLLQYTVPAHVLLVVRYQCEFPHTRKEAVLVS